jgi:hypothetical protein
MTPSTKMSFFENEIQNSESRKIETEMILWEKRSKIDKCREHVKKQKK